MGASAVKSKFVPLFLVLALALCASLLAGCGSKEEKKEVQLVTYESPTGQWSTQYSDNFTVSDEKDGSVFTVTSTDGSVTYGIITVSYLLGGDKDAWLADKHDKALNGKYGKIAEDTSVSDVEDISLDGHNASSVTVVIDDGTEGTGYYFIADAYDDGIMTYTLQFTQTGFDGVSREFTNLISNMQVK